MTEVQAVHEMDGTLTRSDKQPASINIPLSLVLFLRGSKSILHCRIIRRIVRETVQIQPHVGPPVAKQMLDFSKASIKRLHKARCCGTIVLSQAPSAAG